MKSLKHGLIGIAGLSVASQVGFAQNVYVNGNLGVANSANVTGAVTATTYFYSPGYILLGSYAQVASLKIGGSTPVNSFSAAIGVNSVVSSYSSLVVGRNNATVALDGTAATATSWIDKDPLFIVGNGTGVVGANQYRNALAVYKDGTITMSKVQGDIGMGQFGN